MLEIKTRLPKRMTPFHIRTADGQRGSSKRSVVCQAAAAASDRRAPSEKPPHQAQTATGTR